MFRSTFSDATFDTVQAARPVYLSYSPKYGRTNLQAGPISVSLRANRMSLVNSHGVRRCVMPVPYYGEQEAITVLELVPTKGGGVKIGPFMSDRVFQKYRVATEFYDSGTILPPHQLIVNAIRDVDLGRAALAGAQSLLLHTTAPIVNHPTAVIATGRCDIARRLSVVPGLITPRTMTLSRELLEASEAGAKRRSSHVGSSKAAW